VPSLREVRGHRLLVRTLHAGSDRFGFRLVEFSVQTNHLHLIVEVPDQHALTRGAKGLFVRLAKQLNKLWNRKGNVFPERYHARALETPKAVRNALVYVLHNARKHRAWGSGLDPFSSGAWFDGYRASQLLKLSTVAPVAGPPNPGSRIASEMRGWPRATQPARTWLLGHGWRKHGLLEMEETPKLPG
jgi:REP element-mobilizing transposase RayT